MRDQNLPGIKLRQPTGAHGSCRMTPFIIPRHPFRADFRVLNSRMARALGLATPLSFNVIKEK